MRVFGLVALPVIAAETAPDVPTWAYLVGVGLPGFLVLLGSVRWYTGRMEKRLLGAQADTEHATTDLTEQKTEEIKEQLRLSVLESVRDDMARQREETARAQAAEKEAIAEVAILIAQHARDRAEWKDERHDFINQLRNRDNQITMLRAEVHNLREEVHTLRVALGVEQERRVDNVRLSHLESRADVSETRADVAEKKADKAQDVAIEQEHRNDDTPGHA